MKKVLLLTTVLLMGLAGMSLAEDCVEVDVELTPVVAAGEVAEGFFELTNCGDEGADVTLAFNIDINGEPVEVGEVVFPLGAGETVSKDFHTIVPEIAVGYTVELCVTATIGTAEDSDCASMEVVAGSGEKNLTFTMAASDGECVEVDLELPDTVISAPESHAEGYFELTNCGDEAAWVQLDVEITVMSQGIEVRQWQVYLGAAETLSRELVFPVPQGIPEGTVTVCVTATIGDAVSTSCQTVEVVSGEPGKEDATLKSSNFPNPFNPSTRISFTMPQAGEVSIDIFNIMGQKVRTLASGTEMTAGDNMIEWNGRNDSGDMLTSGTYFYRIEAGGEVVTQKMVLLK